jgi:hypothetical protein
MVLMQRRRVVSADVASDGIEFSFRGKAYERESTPRDEQLRRRDVSFDRVC